MRRKRVIAAGVTIVLVILWRLVLPPDSKPKEPAYQGKLLHAWLHEERMRMEASYGKAHSEAAVAAVRALGTNALPWLLYTLKQQPVRAKVGNSLWEVSLLPRSTAIRTFFENALLHHDEATIGFQILGTNAFPAIPELTRMVQSQTNQSRSPFVSAYPEAILRMLTELQVTQENTNTSATEAN